MSDRTTQERHIRQIFAEIKDQPLACFEVEQRLGLLHQTASARIAEMTHVGLLEITAERRETPNSSPTRKSTARVYRVAPGADVEAGIQLIDEIRRAA